MNSDGRSVKTLFDLYNEHSGKISDRWQSYLQNYQQFLEGYREENIRILEIGIQNGGSLEIWAKYFPNAEKIVGCDIDPRCQTLSYNDERIHVVVGDANEEACAEEILNISERFDVIIDDGSHESGDIIRAFTRYYQNLNPGGIFIVEDLHCSYWEGEFNGGLNAPFSSISFFKRLCDALNFEHWGAGVSVAQAFDYFSNTYEISLNDEDLLSIESIVFKNSLCAIYRTDSGPARLGTRVVVGENAVVSSEPIAVKGLTLTAPDQSKNRWGLDLGPSEQITADVFEAQARERNLKGRLASEQETVELLREKIAAHKEVAAARERNLKGRLASEQETVELLREKIAAHKEVAAEVAAEFAARVAISLGLIDEIIPHLRHPIRSRIASRAARWAARLPGLSERRRQRFRRSAYKRDTRALLSAYKRDTRAQLEVFLQARLDPKRTSISYAHGSEAIFPSDLDGIELPASTARTDIDIVVCIHNALNDVKACLSSIIANTPPPYRLILVDDGSQDETKLYLEAFAAAQRTVLLRSDKAGGYTRAANRGLRASRAPWTLLLNSDTIVPFGWTDELLKVAQSDPEIGIVGPASNTASWQSAPTLFNEDGDWAGNSLPHGVSIQQMQTIASSIAPPQGIDLPFLNGFAFMIRRKLIDDIGLFDEETFGAGFGEENDYCIRARKAGWKLIFAPNAYIFHAQSKSYTSEKRLKLAADASENLHSKHDADRDVLPQVTYCKDSLATLSFRTRFATILEDINTSEHPYAGKRIAILCPVGRSGGGGNILVQEAALLDALGVQVWLINLTSNQTAFEETYQSGVASMYFNGPQEIRHFLQKNELKFDAIVASAYFTTHWLPDRFDGEAPRLGYYIQDDEPAFFESGTPEHKDALQSYGVLRRALGFTKTNWNADAIERYGFPRPAVVGASVDLSRFRPKGRNVEASERVRIAAMVRFDVGVNRRAPERTMRVLNHLAEAYGERVELTVFGSDPNHVEKSMLNPKVKDLGILRPNEVATLMRNIDVFLDFSIWQAMGLSAMEAMASGCAVVVPRNGGAGDFCVDQHNALIVDSHDDESCYAAARRLVEDDALLTRMRQAATREICAFSQVRSARRILDELFG